MGFSGRASSYLGDLSAEAEVPSSQRLLTDDDVGGQLAEGLRDPGEDGAQQVGNAVDEVDDDVQHINAFR